MKASRPDRVPAPRPTPDLRALPAATAGAADLTLVPDDAAADDRDECRDDGRSLTRAERLAAIHRQDVLSELAVRAEMYRSDSPFYSSERLVGWLDHELNSPQRASAGWSAARIAAAAARTRAKFEAARSRVRLVSGSPVAETPPVAGMVCQVMGEAVAMRAAPQLDLGVAAGVGRDLWDETCEQWVRIPDDAPSGQYVSLRVVGESMDPLLHTGDSVLVHVGAEIARDAVVLARVPDAGYVVKRVGTVTRSRLELLSLNPAFPPITIAREDHTVVGTVILRWCPHGVSA